MCKMSDLNSIQTSIEQYEGQLLQVQKALSTTANPQDRENLLSLQSDLQELINLTKESLNEISPNSSSLIKKNSDNVLDNEYALFQAEMEKLDGEQSQNSQEVPDDSNNSVIEDELKALEGSKCCAPYGSSWGGITYHNAMICHIEQDEEEGSSLANIMARVLFINPTHKEMLPCPYFLDGSCKFSEDQCHFSHGHVVPFEQLKEYREPDYSKLKDGSRVLAKQKNQLWHRSIILKTPETEGEEYRIKFEASGAILEVGIHDLLPLTDSDLNMSDSSDESDSESDLETNSVQEEIVTQSLLTISANEELGKWEQFTRGMGSKLMAKMGYITGTGLGKRADGRVEPVEATVLPSGKSLDHCMALREMAGGDKDFFSAEKKMRKQERKLELQRQKEYLKEKEKEKHNVFNFINTTLGDKKEDPEPCPSTSKKNLKLESSKNLNVESLKVGENIAKLERETMKIKNSLSKHDKGSVYYNNLLLKYNVNQKELSKLKTIEKNIDAEKNQRKNKEKLSIF